MKIILERHNYAPELNKAYIGPTRTMIKVPGCTSIKQVREKHFAPLKYKGRHVRIASKYPAPFAWLNAQRSGFCNDLRSLAGALTIFRQRLAQDKGPVVELKTQLIG